MNALADKGHKQKVPHTQYGLHNIATLFNNHPYISSSKCIVPTGACHSYTYVGMIVE